jgi:hypothetical protein
MSLNPNDSSVLSQAATPRMIPETGNPDGTRDLEFDGTNLFPQLQGRNDLKATRYHARVQVFAEIVLNLM